MIKGLKSLLLCFLVLLFFAFMSALDFIVHRVLYNYGLVFSYEWATLYWIVFGSIFLIFAFLIGFIYLMSSNAKNQKDLRVAVGLSLSICLMFAGGLEDILFFVLWDGGLPGDFTVWWWMPWCGLLGFWNSACQVYLFGVVSVVVVLLWIWILDA
jgi:hypothetical protein